MQAILPYPYTENFVWSGGHRTRNASKIGYIKALVPEIASSEMELFARWTANENGTPSGEPQERICMTFDRSMYMQVFDWDDRPVDRLPSKEGEEFNREIWYGILDSVGRLDGKPSQKIEQALRGNELTVPTWSQRPVGSDQASQESRAKDLIDGLILVDGYLWQKCAAPRIRCDVWFSEPRKFVYAPVATGVERISDNGHPSRVWFFGMSEVDALDAHALSAGARASYDDLEVFGREDIPFIGRNELAARTMDHIVRAIDVASIPADVVSDWVSMRDASASFYNNGEDRLDDNWQALRRFSRSLLPTELAERVGSSLAFLDSLNEAHERAYGSQTTPSLSVPRRSCKR
jgi:hypothetical protein